MGAEKVRRGDNNTISIHPAMDRQWIDGIRAGDIDIFERVYLAYYERLWRIAFAFLHTRTDAEDAVQTVFIRLWDGRATLPDITSSLEAYLHGAVRNECLRVLKHERVVERTECGEYDHRDLPGMSAPLSNADVALEREETQSLIDRTIAALPERRRIALTLRWVDGLEYQEIADILEISVDNAYMLVARAREQVRRALEGKYP
jgi:RNA polymerase sigma-70 factor (ECF subfamily)